MNMQDGQTMRPTQDSKLASIVAIVVAAVGVIVGFGDMPYGYYMLLRLVFCGVSLYLLFGAERSLLDWHRWALGVSAVLYNPVLPIRLGDKGLWTIANVLTLVLFGLVRFRPSPGRTHREEAR